MKGTKGTEGTERIRKKQNIAVLLKCNQLYFLCLCHRGWLGGWGGGKIGCSNISYGRWWMVDGRTHATCTRQSTHKTWVVREGDSSNSRIALIADKAAENTIGQNTHTSPQQPRPTKIRSSFSIGNWPSPTSAPGVAVWCKGKEQDLRAPDWVALIRLHKPQRMETRISKRKATKYYTFTPLHSSILLSTCSKQKHTHTHAHALAIL